MGPCKIWDTRPTLAAYFTGSWMVPESVTVSPPITKQTWQVATLCVPCQLSEVLLCPLVAVFNYLVFANIPFGSHTPRSSFSLSCVCVLLSMGDQASCVPQRLSESQQHDLTLLGLRWECSWWHQGSSTALSVPFLLLQDCPWQLCLATQIPGLGTKNYSKNSLKDIFCGLLNLKVLLLGSETLGCKELVVGRWLWGLWFLHLHLPSCRVVCRDLMLFAAQDMILDYIIHWEDLVWLFFISQFQRCLNKTWSKLANEISLMAQSC